MFVLGDWLRFHPAVPVPVPRVRDYDGDGLVQVVLMLEDLSGFAKPDRSFVGGLLPREIGGKMG